MNWLLYMCSLVWVRHVPVLEKVQEESEDWYRHYHSRIVPHKELRGGDVTGVSEISDVAILGDG